MTGRVLVLPTRSLLAAATTLAVLVMTGAATTALAATTDGDGGGLTSEVLTLDLGGLSTCAAGATSYSFPASGTATGSVAGPVEATVSTSVSDGNRVSTITFSVNGGELQGTQTTSAPGEGACAAPADGTSAWNGTLGGVAIAGTGVLVSGLGQLTDTLTEAAPEPPPTDPPSATPTDGPSPTPTDPPTATPTDQPSTTPTDVPTSTPTGTPTATPTDPATTPPDSGLAFSYHVVNGPAGPSGTCTVTTGVAQPGTITCLDATSYKLSGKKLTFSGPATVDGIPTTYTITVMDGQPDSFRISTGTGFSGGGILTNGSLKVQ